jgi:Flp pilus assembly protein TadD
MAAPETNAPDDTNRRFDALAIAVLVLAVLAAHGVTLLGEFVYDDRFIIVENEAVGDPSEWGRFFTEGTWAGAGIESTNYRPLPMLTFGLNHAVGGLEPFGYHLANLLAHLANAILLFVLARRLGWSREASWFAAALFAVHPMTGETVASVVGRMDLMAATALLGGLICHVTARQREVSGLKAAPWFVSAAVLYGLALLSKEHVVVFPVIALVSDIAWGVWKPARRLLVYVAYGNIALVYLALRYLVFGGLLIGRPISLLDNALAPESVPVRFVSALWVWGLYLKHLIFPTRISPDYSYAQIIPFESATSGGALVTCVAAAIVVAAAIWLGRRSRRAAFALALAVLPFLPVSNLFFSIGTVMGERLFYLSIAGLALLAGLGWMVLSAVSRPVTRVAALILLVALAMVTSRQNRHWQSDPALNAYAVTVARGSARIRNNVGHDMLERGDLQGAFKQLAIADAIYPDWYLPVSGLAKVALKQGRLEQALAHALRARELATDPIESLALIADIQMRRGDQDAAREAWRELLQHDADNASTLSNLAILEWEAGDRDSAVARWERAARQPAAASGVLLNLGRAYDHLGRFREAVAAYRRYLASDPEDARNRTEAATRLRELESKPRPDGADNEDPG